MKYDYCIGLDLGTHTGISIYEASSSTLVCCQTVKIHVALKMVEECKQANPKLLVRFENMKSWVPFGGRTKATDSRLAGAGSIKRDMAIWEDYLADEGIEYQSVSLTAVKKKVSASYFKQLTGWTGVTNEHSRDAGLLCYRVNMNQKATK